MYRTNKLCYWTKAKAKDEKYGAMWKASDRTYWRGFTWTVTPASFSTSPVWKKTFNVSFRSVNMKGLKQNDRKKSVVMKVKRMYANLDKKKKAKGSQVVRCNWG